MPDRFALGLSPAPQRCRVSGGYRTVLAG